MDFLISLYKFVAFETATPTNYDAYHFVWIGITIATAILLVCLCRKMSDKNVRIMAAVLWGILVVLEITKQLLFSLHIEDNKFIWDYAWYSFPFQFCSSPLYILPIVAFVKNEKIHNAAIAFMATFSLFAGLCVYVFPNDVFMHLGFINAQTMFHHGSQVFFGIYLAFRYREKMNFKNLIKATVVFSILAGIAMIMNVGIHNYFVANGIGDTFNMFFISPYHDCTLPVLSIVHDMVPYPVFLVIYILGFMICAGLIMLIFKGLVKLTRYEKFSV